MTTAGEPGEHADVRRLVETAFGAGITVLEQSDVGRGKGSFSEVRRLVLSNGRAVVAKLPIGNENRQAAAASGAYRREAMAYRELLLDSPVRTPQVHAIVENADDDGPTAALLMEDLSPLRHVDQLDGLEADDARSVAVDLARFHHHWRRLLTLPGNKVQQLAVRHSTVSTLDPAALSRGLRAVESRWPAVDGARRAAFEAIVDNHQDLVRAFESAIGGSVGPLADGPTLCHGDPRADNLCFAQDGSTVLFDWQQIAVQFAEADLAWLTATSLEPDVRRAVETDLVELTAGSGDRYRIGLILPAMAALLLAQRRADEIRTARFIEVSLQRIAAALLDHEVAAIRVG